MAMISFNGGKINTTVDVIGELSSDINKNAEDLKDLSHVVNKNRDDIEDISNTITRIEENSIARERNIKLFIKMNSMYERYKLFGLIYNITYSSALVLYILGMIFVDGAVSNVFYHLIFAIFISINLISCFICGYKSSEVLTDINKK